MRGVRVIPALRNDSDTLVLNPYMIALYVAAELLARDDSKDAPMKLTKAELLRSCWGAGAGPPASRTLERHAARLRRRLGRHAPMLVTVWGVGYRLDEPA